MAKIEIIKNKVFFVDIKILIENVDYPKKQKACDL